MNVNFQSVFVSLAALYCSIYLFFLYIEAKRTMLHQILNPFSSTNFKKRLSEWTFRRHVPPITFCQGTNGPFFLKVMQRKLFPPTLKKIWDNAD